MTYFEKLNLVHFLSSEVMDEACNSGEDHGSVDKNVAPSAIDGDEKAKDTPVSYDDKPENENGLKISQDAADGYLKMCKDAAPRSTPRKLYPYVGKSASGEMNDFVRENHGALNATSGTGRKHADGTPCKAQSPESCPFNKKVEAGEKEITGKEIDSSKTENNKETDYLLSNVLFNKNFLNDVMASAGPELVSKYKKSLTDIGMNPSNDILLMSIFANDVVGAGGFTGKTRDELKTHCLNYMNSRVGENEKKKMKQSPESKKLVDRFAYDKNFHKELMNDAGHDLIRGVRNFLNDEGACVTTDEETIDYISDYLKTGFWKNNEFKGNSKEEYKTYCIELMESIADEDLD